MPKFYRDEWEVTGPKRAFAMVMGIAGIVAAAGMLYARLFSYAVTMVPFTIFYLRAGFKGESTDDKLRAQQEGRYRPPRRHTW